MPITTKRVRRNLLNGEQERLAAPEPFRFKPCLAKISSIWVSRELIGEENFNE